MKLWDGEIKLADFENIILTDLRLVQESQSSSKILLLEHLTGCQTVQQVRWGWLILAVIVVIFSLAANLPPLRIGGLLERGATLVIRQGFAEFLWFAAFTAFGVFVLSVKRVTQFVSAGMTIRFVHRGLNVMLAVRAKNFITQVAEAQARCTP